MSDESTQLSSHDWDTARRVLRAVLRDPTLADADNEFKTLVSGVNRLGRKHARQQELAARPVVTRRETAGQCYICKERFQTPHPSNPLLCPACGERNFNWRTQRTDLTGRVALLTGGRIKIGYTTSLKLLRDGARVVVTTRFPQDALRRYAQEADYTDWASNLQLYGLDLRDLRGVQELIEHLNVTEPHLDILINNAAQTISRPSEFYSHLTDGERRALPAISGQANILKPAPTFLLEGTGNELAHYFPHVQFDEDGQQLDLRDTNSWSARLDDVTWRELLEVQLVNSSSPFMLCQSLLPLLRRSPFERRFIVNVSAMEGQFTRKSKTERHPHTNMAKAALNMLTRTSGPELALEGIYMTSVDTGWVTNENPFPKAQRMQGMGFVTPLDVLDGASRVYAPIVSGLSSNEKPFAGVFLKDYCPYPW